MVDRENFVYRSNEYTYNFRTTNSFGRDIYNAKFILIIAFINFKSKRKLQNPEKKLKKKDILKNLYALFDGRERVLDAFESGTSPIKIEGTGFSAFDHSNLKILTRKQMLERLPIALAQVKAINTSENLLNEIRQIIYYLYRAKEITKKLYNNTINSINV